MLGNADELNNYEYVYSDKELESILKEYFDVMDISDEQKEKRVKVAKDFRDALLFLFTLITVAYEYDYFSFDYVAVQFKNKFSEVILKYGKYDEYLKQYVDKITYNLLETTYRNANFEKKDFWLSDERGIIVAENEANSFCNYENLQEAIEQGYTMKQWVTERDSRVRKTHKKIDGKTIPIDKYFEFPDCKGLFPHDASNLSDKELANCRCTLKFS